MSHDGGKEVARDGEDSYKIYQQPTHPAEHRGYTEVPHEARSPPQQRKERRYSLLWLVIAAVTGAIIAALALAPSLGVLLGRCKMKQSDDDSSQTSDNITQLTTALHDCTINSTTLETTLQGCLAGHSISATNYAPLPPSAVVSLSNDCVNGTTYSVPHCAICSQGAVYQRICDIDIPPNARGQHKFVAHLLGMVAYSIESCIDACDNYNAQQVFYGRQNPQGTGDGMWCHGVTWQPELSSKYTTIEGNCWLKNDTLADMADAVSVEGNISALLAAAAVYHW